MGKVAGLVLAIALCQVQLASAQQGGFQGAGDTFSRMQMMQEEISSLRGAVEELTHELEKLKKRQQDDYQDLDSRLSAAPGSAPGELPPRATAPPAANADEIDPILAAAEGGGYGVDDALPQPGAPGPDASGNELRSYTAAYDLLKDRKIDQAVMAFTAHLQQYPTGKYAANAHYWLGEIYLLQNKLGAAETSFATVVNNFTTDRKAPDAMFKLGRVYHLQGQTAKAKAILERAVNTNSSASALAKAYLQENF